MKKILVPTDLSTCATNAIRYALNFQKDYPCELVFLYAMRPAIDLPDSTMGYVDPIIYRDEEEQRTYVNQQLDRLFKELSVDPSTLKFEILLKTGFAVDEINEAAQKTNSDLIIMGTKGASGISKFLFGSITASVIRSSSVSVLAIPEGYEYKKINKLVFATDYVGISSKKTLSPLFELANHFGATIMMFHGIETKEPIAAYIEELQSWKTEKNLHNVKHTNSIANCDDIATGILEFTDQNNGDVIALIPHTYNFFSDLLHHSVSKQIAFESKKPILALH